MLELNAGLNKKFREQKLSRIPNHSEDNIGGVENPELSNAKALISQILEKI